MGINWLLRRRRGDFVILLEKALTLMFIADTLILVLDIRQGKTRLGES